MHHYKTDYFQAGVPRAPSPIGKNIEIFVYYLIFMKLDMHLHTCTKTKVKIKFYEKGSSNFSFVPLTVASFH